MQSQPSLFDPRDQIRWSVILGLSEPSGSGWTKVRATQLEMIRRSAAARLMMLCVAAIILLPMIQETAEKGAAYLWLAIAMVAAILTALPHFTRRKSSPAHFNRALAYEVRLVAISGLVWACVPALFGWRVSMPTLVSIWSILTAIMAGMAVTLAAAPLAAISFIILTGVGLAVMMIANGFLILGGVALSFMVALLFGSLSNGRSFILRHAVEAALAEKREMVSLLLREFDETGGDWLWQTDSDKCLRQVSARFASALGQNTAALEAKPLLQVLAGSGWESGNVSPSLHALSEKLRKRERFSGLMLPVDVAGETHWWELAASPRFDEAGIFIGFRGVGSDVTEAHRSVDRISRMARFDTLTSLPNRSHLMEALEKAITAAAASRGRAAVAMIDLDRFKSVNDSFGHPVGDRLLMQVAERLRSLCSDNEICGRLGGDEFAVVIQDANDPERVKAFAWKIVTTLSQPYDVDRHRLIIGASVGTASSPRDGRTVDMLVRSADLALYQSKNSGGTGVSIYGPTLQAEAEERRLAEIALHTALDRNEMALVYQPILDVTVGKIVAFEALLRWTHPDLGVIPAERFLPIARDTRLIVPIGDWVLQTACIDACRWPDDVGVTTDIAEEQLRDASFLASVKEALALSGIAPHRLSLTIAEATLQQAGPAGLAVLEHLDALGIRLSLGEFGTASSALGHLNQSRFAAVNIHRGLIGKAAEEDRDSSARLRAITMLADNLGIVPTVQGVETDAHLRTARSLGCRQVQGSLFGAPLSPADVCDQFRQNAWPRAVA